MMKIVLFYRKKNSRQYSIEQVYNSLKDRLGSDNDVIVREVPFKSKGIIRRVLNGLYCWIHQSEVNHITGDINYVGIFLPKKNTVLTVHDIYPLLVNKGFKRYILKKVWYEWPIRMCKKVVFVSHFTKDEVLRLFPSLDINWEIIENPIPEEFNLNLKHECQIPPTILQVGIKQNKNLETIAKALNDIDSKLIIVGKLNAVQKEMMKRYKINYTCHDAVSNKELYRLYVQSDLVLFVSKYEGFGLPIIEAQTIGRPVITSNLSSMPEVAGEGGLLVDPKSADEIKAGIKKILEHDEFRKELIQKGLKNVERFRPEVIANKYQLMYKEVINGK